MNTIKNTPEQHNDATRKPGRKRVNRRTILKTGLLGAGGALLAYQAYDFARDSRARAKVVVVGGGSAGITMVARLQAMLHHPDITLIEPNAVHHYQPGYTLIAGNEFKPQEILMPEADLIPSRVKWLQDRVIELDPDHNALRTAANGRITYDFLVMVPKASTAQVLARAMPIVFMTSMAPFAAGTRYWRHPKKVQAGWSSPIPTPR